MKTPKRKSEDAFRDILAKAMKGHWAMTWHEDREISPGVPDCHFSMNPAPEDSYFGSVYRFEIGWLELKSTDSDVTPSNRIGIEPSQHQYIRTWKDRTPIFFLVRVKEMVYLIPGERHSALAFAGSNEEIAQMAVSSFPQQEISEKLPHLLRGFTRI